MKHLWADLDQIKTMISQSEKLLLLLDYDGTLAPIADTPEEAICPLRAKAALQQLVQLPRYRVGIISGRAADDVAGMVGLRGITYAGNHGLELLYSGGRWVHPEALRLRPKLAEVVQGLAQELGHIPGLRIEDKGATVSVHYRLVAGDPREEIQRRAQKVLEPFAAYFQLTEGKKVLEVRPAVSFHKGAVIYAITQIVNAKESDLVIYIGDDLTDEDGFRVVEDSGAGISVFVGEPDQHHPDSIGASYFLKSPAEVATFLEMLLEQLQRSEEGGPR